MVSFSQARAEQSRGLLLVLLLLLALTLAAVLAREAYQASVSHRAVAQDVVRDYVEVAGWELSRAARNYLSEAFARAIEGSRRVLVAPAAIPRTVPGDPLRSSLDPLSRADSHTGSAQAKETYSPWEWDVSLRTVFIVDQRSGNIVVYGASLPGAAIQVLHDVHTDLTTAGNTEVPCTLIVRRWPGETEHPIIIGLTRGPLAPDGPHEVYGFAVARDSLTRLLEQTVVQRTLLPPTLTRGREGNAALSIRVTDEANEIVFETPGFPAGIQPMTASSFDANERSPSVSASRIANRAGTGPRTSWNDDTVALIAQGRLTRQFGGLAYQVAMRPDAAEGLVIGELPRSRLRNVLAVLALTAGLIIAALVLLRRQYELARVRSNFVAGVSHELRTPLAQIRMFSETLLLGRVRSEHETRRSLEIIHQESRRLGQLVENVLRLSAPHQEPACVVERRRLAPLLMEIVEGFLPLGRARRADVRFVAADDVVCAVDESALRQMVLNLLDNAVKYGPMSQTITVTLRLFNTTARVIVDDEGSGITDIDAERIWAPFARLPRAGKAGITGAGIGLAVVRQLAEKHAGRAWVTRGPKGGARFCLDFPDGALASADHCSPPPCGTNVPPRSVSA